MKKIMKKIKRTLSLLLSFSLLISGIHSITMDASAAGRVKLNKKKILLRVGGSYKLKMKNTKKKVTWKSSHKKIATVNKKGKVVAKKQGTTKVTARIGKKKYVCKVTVKNKRTPETVPVTAVPAQDTAQPSTSPAVTVPTPSAVASTAPALSTTQPAMSASPAATAAPTETPYVPDYEPNDLSSHFDANAQKMTDSILLTVKNKNSEWAGDLNVKFVGTDQKGFYLMEQTVSLGASPGGETQQYAFPADRKLLEQIDIEQSYVFIYAESAQDYHRYYDLKEQVSLDQGALDKESATFPITLTNNSDIPADGNYTVTFYNEYGDLTYALSGHYTAGAKEDFDKRIEVPHILTQTGEQAYPFVNYKINYNAHHDEKLDPQVEDAKLIFVTPQKLSSCLLLTVTNRNDFWLSNVEIYYEIFDFEDYFVTEFTSTLLSLAPAETQYIAVPMTADELYWTDFNHSHITVTPVRDDTTLFQKTSKLSARITSLADNKYEVTLNNTTNSDMEGNYIVYFYSEKIILDAFQEVIQIGPKEKLTKEVTGPVKQDENGNTVPASDSCSVSVVAHEVITK